MATRSLLHTSLHTALEAYAMTIPYGMATGCALGVCVGTYATIRHRTPIPEAFVVAPLYGIVCGTFWPITVWGIVVGSLEDEDFGNNKTKELKDDWGLVFGNNKTKELKDDFVVP